MEKKVKCPICNTEHSTDVSLCSACGYDFSSLGGEYPTPQSPLQGDVISPDLAQRVSPPELATVPGFNLRFAAFMIDFLLVYTAVFLMNQFIGVFISAIIWPAYFVILTVMYGQTPGKKAFNLGVLSKDGEMPRQRQIIYRELYRFLVVFLAIFLEAPLIITFVGVALLLMGHLAVIYDPLKRAWHDRLSGTQVVRFN